MADNRKPWDWSQSRRRVSRAEWQTQSDEELFDAQQRKYPVEESSGEGFRTDIDSVPAFPTSSEEPHPLVLVPDESGPERMVASTAANFGSEDTHSLAPDLEHAVLERVVAPPATIAASNETRSLTAASDCAALVRMSAPLARPSKKARLGLKVGRALRKASQLWCGGVELPPAYTQLIKQAILRGSLAATATLRELVQFITVLLPEAWVLLRDTLAVERVPGSLHVPATLPANNEVVRETADKLSGSRPSERSSKSDRSLRTTQSNIEVVPETAEKTSTVNPLKRARSDTATTSDTSHKATFPRSILKNPSPIFKFTPNPHKHIGLPPRKKWMQVPELNNKKKTNPIVIKLGMKIEGSGENQLSALGSYWVKHVQPILGTDGKELFVHPLAPDQLEVCNDLVDLAAPGYEVSGAMMQYLDNERIDIAVRLQGLMSWDCGLIVATSSDFVQTWDRIVGRDERGGQAIELGAKFDALQNSPFPTTHLHQPHPVLQEMSFGSLNDNSGTSEPRYVEASTALVQVPEVEAHDIEMAEDEPNSSLEDRPGPSFDADDVSPKPPAAQRKKMPCRGASSSGPKKVFDQSRPTDKDPSGAVNAFREAKDLNEPSDNPSAASLSNDSSEVATSNFSFATNGKGKVKVSDNFGGLCSAVAPQNAQPTEAESATPSKGASPEHSAEVEDEEMAMANEPERLEEPLPLGQKQGGQQTSVVCSFACL